MSINLFHSAVPNQVPITPQIPENVGVAGDLTDEPNRMLPWWKTWSEPVLAWGVTRLICLFFLYAGWLYWPIQLDFRQLNAAAGPKSDLAAYYHAWAAHPEEYDPSPMIGLEVGDEWKWISPLFRWDSFWYLSISEVGYVLNRDPGGTSILEDAKKRSNAPVAREDRREQNLVFFPVFPLMIRILGYIGIPAVLAALLISNVATLLTSCVLYEFVRRMYNEQVARWTTWAWLLYPASFFGTVAYSDSLMALAVVGAMWYVQRQRYIVTGLIVGLTSAMRPPGILLGAVLIDGWIRRRWLSATIGMALSGMGLVTYFWYLGQEFGDPFIYFKAISSWGNYQETASQWNPIRWFFKIFNSVRYSLELMSTGEPVGNLYSWRIADPLMFVWILFYLPTVRKLGWGQSLFSIGTVLLILTQTSSLASVGRYGWVILPVFIACGLRLSESRFRWPMIAAMTLGLCWSACLFGGYWEII
ncbi:MAG: mannosyltransferase family protein [Planctomycetota bacterium]|nr:mannosyltransferase family protein [Planctomycetota bacterium]